MWGLIEATPQLDWLLLTKRPGNVSRMVPWGQDWPRNVWIGTSVENEDWADRRLPVLSELPATVRFVSAEPLLGDYDVGGYRVDWVIAGGESGHGCRPLDPEHFWSLRDQCQQLSIPFFFEQWGGRTPNQRGREWSDVLTRPLARTTNQSQSEKHSL